MDMAAEQALTFSVGPKPFQSLLSSPQSRRTYRSTYAIAFPSLPLQPVFAGGF
jgi:hypothetical protein